jgi:hypothetical protein
VRTPFLHRVRGMIIVGPMAVFFPFCAATARSQADDYDFNDTHFHLTNNVQEGPSVSDFLNLMGNRVGRGWQHIGIDWDKGRHAARCKDPSPGAEAVGLDAKRFAARRPPREQTLTQRPLSFIRIVTKLVQEDQTHR